MLTAMTNKFETDGPVTRIFVNRRTGPPIPYLIDTDDLLKISLHTWRRNGCGYAYTFVPKGSTSTAMSRIVAGTPLGLDADHINGDYTDNRKANLRNVTRSVNKHNHKILPSNVYPHSGGGWVVQFGLDYKIEYFGRFADRAEAVAVAAKIRARLLNGERVEGLPPRETPSGVRGISWVKKRNHWVVHLWDGKRQIWVGSTADLEEAKEMLVKAKVDHGT